jgi:hypothetical protein
VRKKHGKERIVEKQVKKGRKEDRKRNDIGKFKRIKRKGMREKKEK